MAKKTGKKVGAVTYLKKDFPTLIAEELEKAIREETARNPPGPEDHLCADDLFSLLAFGHVGPPRTPELLRQAHRVGSWLSIPEDGAVK